MHNLVNPLISTLLMYIVKNLHTFKFFINIHLIHMVNVFILVN